MKPDTRVFWYSWAALFLLTSAWVLGNPLMASPDEPQHALKAASVVRGQLDPPDGDGGSEVRVPYYYNLLTAYPCYVFAPEKTGSCDVRAERPLGKVVDAVTPAGRYNPLYYAVVGLPTLAPPGDGVMYAMRMISAALSTFFLALGLRSLAQAPFAAWAVPGAAAALTPMVVFLSSNVNPAGVEITAAFALWCQLLTLLRHPDPSRTVSRVAWIALATLFLANARGLSLLYGAVIVVAVVAASRWSDLLDVLRTRRTWPSFAVVGAACLAAAGWVLGTNSLGSGGAVAYPELSFLKAAETTVILGGTYLRNMIGQFGWTDTDLPSNLHIAYAIGAGVVLVLALAMGTWRERAVLVGLAGASFVLPVLIHASQARYLGIIWQGRYILPVAIGIPLLAGYIVAARVAALPPQVRAALRRPGAAIATTVAAVLAVVQLSAFVVNLHRYVNGIHGGWFALEPDAWLPPVPLAAVVALGVVGAGAFCAVLAWSAWSLSAEQPEPVVQAADGATT